MDDMAFRMNAWFGREAAEKVEGVKAKMLASMGAVLDRGWSETDETGLFRAAVGGALWSIGYDTAEGRQVRWNMEVLEKITSVIQAAERGVPVDFSQAFPGETVGGPLPLIMWWTESKVLAARRKEEAVNAKEGAVNADA